MLKGYLSHGYGADDGQPKNKTVHDTNTAHGAGKSLITKENLGRNFAFLVLYYIYYRYIEDVKLFNGENTDTTFQLDDSFDDTNMRFVRRI